MEAETQDVSPSSSRSSSALHRVSGAFGVLVLFASTVTVASRLTYATEIQALAQEAQQNEKLANMERRRLEESEKLALKRIQALNDLASAEQNRSSQLAASGFNELAPVGEPRFVPRTYEQFKTATLTLWNMLDRLIEKASVGNPASPGTPFGYMRVVQLEAYTRFVWDLQGSPRYCEIGFNGGHGVAAMLLAHPRLTAISFELGDRPYTAQAVALLQDYFGRNRLLYHKGDSAITVPSYAKSRDRVLCDVALVDGSHSRGQAYSDIAHMNTIAKPGAVLLIDDINEGPGLALRKAETKRLVHSVVWHEYNETAPENPCIRRVRKDKRVGASTMNSRAPSKGFWHCSPKWGYATATLFGNGLSPRSPTPKNT